MRSLLLTLLIGMSVVGTAQVQHNRWFMGFNAGLDFSSGAPLPVAGSLSTDEGCASISDAAGQLLFFTNGQTVWDQTMAPMFNGMGLNGHFSSSQSCLIVPMPDNPDLYYIFTTPADAGVSTANSGMFFSIVDMTQNGGLGAVTTLNTALADPVVEKLTATRHRNGKDVWVIAHGWNNTDYYAYLVSCTGVHGPVVTSIGRSMAPDAFGGSIASTGCMRASRGGNRIATVWTNPTPPTAVTWASSAYLDVLDFDNGTGVLSNVLSDSIGGGFSDQTFGYGVEFDATASYLYVSTYGTQNGGAISQIHQYDLSVPDPMTTNLEVGVTNTDAHGTIQMGPDGKLYIARLNGSTFLSTISFPSVLSTGCFYTSVGTNLGGNPSTWGLPNNWDTQFWDFTYDPIPWEDSLVCLPTLEFGIDWPHPFDTPRYLWSTGDTTATIEATEDGRYTVEVQLACSTVFDTVHLTFGGVYVDLGPDQNICEDAEVTLEIEPEDAQVFWITGDSTPYTTVIGKGVYYVSLLDDLGCATSDTIEITDRNCYCPVYMPNVFTPNGDGHNEYFSTHSDCQFVEYELSIYDRWGALLYETIDPEAFWTGDGAPFGVYVVRLRYSWWGFDGLQTVNDYGTLTITH